MNNKRQSRLRLILRVMAAVSLSLLLYVGMRGLVVPGLFKLSDDFSYKADIISIDNFYDEGAKQFQGEERTVTSFGYDVSEQVEDGLIVEGYFTVRTVEGDTVVSVKRNYGINPYTREHIWELGDQNRAGNLFAPRHLNKGESFEYWHVNYNTSLWMDYQDEEVIDGLTVYRYTAEFSVDQSEELSHLEGVPEERGVNLDVALQLWVEPVSGWLVKYEDHTIAYYYDQATGERTNPWNDFSNRYQKSSVDTHATIASKMKIHILLLEIYLPVLSLILTLSFLLWKKHKRISPFLLIGGSALLSLIFILINSNPWAQEDPLVVGITRWVPQGNAAIDDNIQGFKDALELSGYHEGKDVIYIEGFANGNAKQQSEILQSFLEENVDLIYSLTTPGTLIAKEIVPSVPIVFSVVTYPVEVGLIESMQHSGNNLVGTRNWVPVEDQLNIFLEIVPTTQTLGFLHRTGEPNSEIQFTEMKAAAEERGIEVIEISGANLSELLAALEEASSVDSLYSSCDTLISSEAEDLIIAYAHEHLIPSFSCNISGPFNGDLIGTVADLNEIGQLAGKKAVLILDGAPPSAIETNTVNTPFIYINRSTAELLGITIPQTLSSVAEEIISN